MYEHNQLAVNYPRAFKDADVRGVYPTEINEALTYAIARAFIEEFSYKKIVVGYDMRLSTPTLQTAFVTGARDAGADVVDVGMVATPQLYFASGSLKLPGVMITASHSPKEYNGLKLVHAGAIPLTKRNGLAQIKKRVKEESRSIVAERGRVTKRNIDQGYLRYVLAGVKAERYNGLRIATDIGNGMAHNIIPLLRSRLPIHFDTLFAKLDGSFPNRDSDPNLRGNQLALDAKLDHGHYDFGISFDGDADRIAFLDEAGNYVNSAAIGALIADIILEKEPKATFVTTTFNSRIYDETIKQGGGRVVIARTGHTFLKEKMYQHEAVFGCEYSGHFFFRDFFYTDSVVLTLRYVLDAYIQGKAAGKRFSELVAPYCGYEQTEDVVVAVKDKKATMAAVSAYLAGQPEIMVKKFDGYVVDYGDVWGAIKESVTEYAVKCMFESTSRSKAKKKQREIVAFLKSVASN